MEIILENEILEVKATVKGAELTSIADKKDNTEYLWTGDAKYWGRQAPILFPTIGKVKNNTFRIADKAFSLGKHGFARDCCFELIENSKETALLRLVWNDETFAVFPYKFELDVRYRLKDSALDVEYTVRNVDKESIYFSIGGHPGFNCPLKAGAFEDYYFEFDARETAETIRINAEGLLKRETMPFLSNSAVIPLTHELFKEDALIFSNLKSQRVALRNTKNSRGVAVDYTGFPYLGLWSQIGEAPFVCIEPWFGLADYEDFDGDFRQKPGVLELERGKEFVCKYIITVLL